MADKGLSLQTRACWNTTKWLFLIAFPFKLTCDASQVHLLLLALLMQQGLASDFAKLSWFATHLLSPLKNAEPQRHGGARSSWGPCS